MKRAILLLTTLLALVVSMPHEAKAARLSKRITITAGTAIQVSTQQIWVKRLFIQAAVGGSGYICVLAAPATSTGLSCSSTQYLVAQLAPASATAPGSSYSDPQGAPGGITVPDIDLSTIFLDGSNNDDPVTVSYEF